MKGYTVFNVEQVDGLPAQYYAQPENPLSLSERASSTRTPSSPARAPLSRTAASARIRPSPWCGGAPFEALKNKESYDSAALHELTHWAKSKHRLDRDFSAKRFGDHGYAREELVAELGAGFLCAELGITPEVGEDHAAYLDHWLTVVKEDKPVILSATACSSSPTISMRQRCNRCKPAGFLCLQTSHGACAASGHGQGFRASPEERGSGRRYGQRYHPRRR
jgi:antirestriction protein ArdC